MPYIPPHTQTSLHPSYTPSSRSFQTYSPHSHTHTFTGFASPTTIRLRIASGLMFACVCVCVCSSVCPRWLLPLRCVVAQTTKVGALRRRHAGYRTPARSVGRFVGVDNPDRLCACVCVSLMPPVHNRGARSGIMCTHNANALCTEARDARTHPECVCVCASHQNRTRPHTHTHTHQRTQKRQTADAGQIKPIT